MPNENEGAVAPDSLEAQALAELQKEGKVLATSQPNANDGEVKDEPNPPKEDIKVEDLSKKEDPKPERTPTMVEAWKLKVAEDQKANLEKDLIDLKAKVEQLSKQKDPVSQTQQDDIANDIQTIADEAGISVEVLTKLTDTILKKAKPSEDITRTIQEIKEQREIDKQENLYNAEFENDVLPLVREYELSDQALSQLKNNLKNLAFTETYARVPLKEIFQLKKDTFDLKSPKKSSEGKGIKIRSEVVDIDNIDEENFSKLSGEQLESFLDKKKSGVWK